MIGFYRNEPSASEVEWRMADCPAPYTCDMTDEEWRAEEQRIDAENARQWNECQRQAKEG